MYRHNTIQPILNKDTTVHLASHREETSDEQFACVFGLNVAT